MGYTYKSFTPSTDIPSLAGKTILITGANAGIGKQTALDLAAHNPSVLWIGARNVESGNLAVSSLQRIAPQTSIKLLKMDLSSFSSIQHAATQVLSESDRLDILILNAGIMGGVPGVTQEGYEKQFGTNHMGHALLLKLLTPLLQTAASTRILNEPRIVILSSSGHATSAALPKGGIDFATLKSPQTHLSGVSKYTQSKLANAVYAAPFAKRFPQFTCVAINPGDIKTELFGKGSQGGGWMVKVLRSVVVPVIGGSVEDGAKNSLWCATREGVVSGVYYDPVGRRGVESEVVKEGKLGEGLWEWTEKELQAYGA